MCKSLIFLSPFLSQLKFVFSVDAVAVHATFIVLRLRPYPLQVYGVAEQDHCRIIALTEKTLGVIIVIDVL